MQKGLLAYLKDFLIELGRDFCFVGSEYPVQVGGRDFSLDLLFFHRGLNCLVAMELKVWREGRPDPLKAGLDQLDKYLAGLGLDCGWLVIFDQRLGLVPIAERTTTEPVKTLGDRDIVLIRG